MTGACDGRSRRCRTLPSSTSLPELACTALALTGAVLWAARWPPGTMPPAEAPCLASAPAHPACALDLTGQFVLCPVASTCSSSMTGTLPAARANIYLDRDSFSEIVRLGTPTAPPEDPDKAPGPRWAESAGPGKIMYVGGRQAWQSSAPASGTPAQTRLKACIRWILQPARPRPSLPCPPTRRLRLMPCQALPPLGLSATSTSRVAVRRGFSG